ncbi:hypothetical protein BKA81DRAFT_108515 [Phyllosticta paracitricarpa]
MVESARSTQPRDLKTAERGRVHRVNACVRDIRWSAERSALARLLASRDASTEMEVHGQVGSSSAGRPTQGAGRGVGVSTDPTTWKRLKLTLPTPFASTPFPASYIHSLSPLARNLPEWYGGVLLLLPTTNKVGFLRSAQPRPIMNCVNPLA